MGWKSWAKKPTNAVGISMVAISVVYVLFNWWVRFVHMNEVDSVLRRTITKAIQELPSMDLHDEDESKKHNLRSTLICVEDMAGGRKRASKLVRQAFSDNGVDPETCDIKPGDCAMTKMLELLS